MQEQVEIQNPVNLYIVNLYLIGPHKLGEIRANNGDFIESAKA